MTATQRPKCGESKERSFIVSEGIAGTWHYHLSDARTPTVALCGAHVMQTAIPLSYWNKTPADFHIPESWCKECGKHLGGLL